MNTSTYKEAAAGHDAGSLMRHKLNELISIVLFGG